VEEKKKPLNGKSYGSIAHLPGSRLGPGDHKCHDGQERIACQKLRDKHDEVIVQEKLDGSNVGVARIDGVIVALTRAGYVANTSQYVQHHKFFDWVAANEARFLRVLRDGERLCGEWLVQAHGTRYKLQHEPFVVFDLMHGNNRMPYDDFLKRVEAGVFTVPHLLHRGEPLSIEAVMAMIGQYGFHGALDPVEGAMWRVERNKQINNNSSERVRVVDFLCKYVRPDKKDGSYLPSETNSEEVWNE